MDHSQHEQYRDESAWEVRQLRLELEAVRKGEEYIRPPRYTVTQKGKEGGSAIPKDKLVKDLLSSLNNLLTPTMEFNKEKKDWVGLTEQQIKILLSDSKCWVGDDCSMPNLNYIIRAVKKAHGIEK